MKKIWSIAYYTFIESVRNKIFYLLILFGVVVIGVSLLLSALGGEQQQRVLLDMGLGAIEFFALVTVIFAAVTLVLEEMESKTIYLVLTRPVSRITYLTGRYLGLLCAVYCGIALMAVIHSAVLLLKGWPFSGRYLLALTLSAEKITIIGSLALFFSLFSTSAVSSLSFTLFFWILGHFSEEIRFLGSKLPGLLPKAGLARRNRTKHCHYYEYSE
jgi:ABC-type transport system involved in multi-copper enzyme maturation permease subunit